MAVSHRFCVQPEEYYERAGQSLSGTFTPHLIMWAAVSNRHSHQELFIANMTILSCGVLSDILITFGMVYTLLSNRTQVRRTNNVLNLLAIYFINCGILHLVFAISCVALLAKFRDSLVYAPSLLITTRLSLCGFILNSRDNLRETLNGPAGVVTFTQLKVHTATAL
ncbi:hypothetical protein H4582DRAFT_2074757 [Lactarius indigo]|nr:hypothetical protein H4582DRAFT_2074757 [Lactarius indigo]